jgi:hypothetical protein
MLEHAVWPERQPLTGKGEKVSGRRSAQAVPRRSRAHAQQQGRGRRRGALQRPTLPAVLAGQPQRTRSVAGTATINRER